MTEYVLREVGRHQWLVFADRQSIALWASENEAVTAMTEHAPAAVDHAHWIPGQSLTRRTNQRAVTH